MKSMTSELGQWRLLKPSVNIIVMTRFLVDLAPFFFEILIYCEIKTTKLGMEKSMKNQNTLLKKAIKLIFTVTSVIFTILVQAKVILLVVADCR